MILSLGHLLLPLANLLVIASAECKSGIWIMNPDRMNTRLTGYKIRTFNNISPITCFDKCIRRPRCNSYNYNRHILRCELNYKPKPGFVENFHNEVGFVYVDVNHYRGDPMYDTCLGNPCKSGEVCETTKDRRVFCVKDQDPVPNPCEPNPCNNGGICTELTADTFSCDCDSAWTGDRCDDPVPNPCEPNPCNNAGSCTELTADTFSCDCDPDWTGDRCDDPVPNPCEPNPCNNAGSCTELTPHTFSCDCDPAWNGDRCDEFISECSLGGGTCGKLASCGGPHSTGGCSHSLNDVCCFDESYGRDGVWPGYYVHDGVQYPWSMSIQFDANSITGGGSESVGTFTINGSWDPLSKDINFVKAYTSNTVSYTGQVTADVCTMYGQYQVGSTTGAFNMTICT